MLRKLNRSEYEQLDRIANDCGSALIVEYLSFIMTTNSVNQIGEFKANEFMAIAKQLQEISQRIATVEGCPENCYVCSKG